VTSPTGGPERGEAVPGLEQRLRRLDEILSALEADDVELQRALELFEEGIAHVRQAEEILARAELRVEELLNADDGSVRTRPLDPGDG
jgi:exodeoxyribonuclease VII small subunit